MLQFRTGRGYFPNLPFKTRIPPGSLFPVFQDLPILRGNTLPRNKVCQNPIYFIFFHENRSLFQCIQTYNLLPRLYAALEAHLNSKAYLLISTYGFESPYEVSALTGMLSKILMDWIRNGMWESVEEMSSIVYNIITKYNCILIP